MYQLEVKDYPLQTPGVYTALEDYATDDKATAAAWLRDWLRRGWDARVVRHGTVDHVIGGQR